jgi:hypothetical protein
MPVAGPLDYLPIWGVFIVTAALLVLAMQAGFWLASHKRQRSVEGQKTAGPVGQVVAGLLALLALLLAFTFSLAASRFDTRRTLVMDEANALGTTWLRAGMLPEPHGTAIRKLLREYLELRLAAVQSGKIVPAVARSEEVQGQLWAEAVAVGQQQPGSIVAGLFIASLNEVIDLHAKRVMYGMRTRIPPNIWALLYVVAMLAVGEIGYHTGMAGARGTLVLIPLILTFSAVILLIVDLDRPTEGMLRTSQQPLMDLRTLMKDSST